MPYPPPSYSGWTLSGRVRMRPFLWMVRVQAEQVQTVKSRTLIDGKPQWVNSQARWRWATPADIFTIQNMHIPF